METIRYGLIGKEDLKLGTGTFEVTLADGRVVLMNAVDVAYFLTDAYTKAGLPAAGLPGRIARVTDSVRGLWMDTGSQWFSLSGERVNVKEFGAKGDGLSDDSDAFRRAIDAVQSNGGTIVLSGAHRLASQVEIPASVKGKLSFEGGHYGYGYDGAAPFSNGTKIITDFAGHGIKINFDQSVAFRGIIFECAQTLIGNGSVFIALDGAGVKFLDCSFIRGYGMITFKDQPQAPWNVICERCLFEDFQHDAVFNGTWITGADQDRPAAIRMEGRAGIKLIDCDLIGSGSLLYAPKGTSNVYLVRGTFQSCAMQLVYTKGGVTLLFMDHTTLEDVTTCKQANGAGAYFSTGGTDNRLAILDLNADNVGTGSRIEIRGMSAIDGATIQADADGSRGRTFLLAATTHVLVDGGNWALGQRPFARLFDTGQQYTIKHAIISTSMRGGDAYPISTLDALNSYGGVAYSAYSRYSPAQAQLSQPGLNQIASLNTLWSQTPRFFPRSGEANFGNQLSRVSITDSLTMDDGSGTGTHTKWRQHASVADNGADSHVGDMIWKGNATTGQRLAFLCVANGSAWGGAGSGSWVQVTMPLMGTGTPEGVVTAPVGTLFLRTDGGAATTLYVKETGVGNTGWVAK